MNIKQRFEELEAKVVEIFKHRDQNNVAPQSLVLKSPNGKYSVTILCNDNGAGIWVSGPNPEDPLVTIYNGFQQGAVVGIYGKLRDGQVRTVLDAAIASNENGGFVMLTDKDQGFHFVQASDIPKIGV